MKKYFPFLILISIILIGGMSSCKKKEIPVDYGAIVIGNYLGVKYFGSSSIGGTYSYDSTINFNVTIKRINNNSIIFREDTMKYADSLSNESVLYFNNRYWNSSAAYEYSYLKFFKGNDSVYYNYDKQYLSGGDGYTFKGKRI